MGNIKVPVTCVVLVNGIETKRNSEKRVIYNSGPCRYVKVMKNKKTLNTLNEFFINYVSISKGDPSNLIPVPCV